MDKLRDGREGGSWTEGHFDSRKVRHRDNTLRQLPLGSYYLLLAHSVHFIVLYHEISDENGNQQHLVIHVDFWYNSKD